MASGYNSSCIHGNIETLQSGMKSKMNFKKFNCAFEFEVSSTKWLPCHIHSRSTNCYLPLNNVFCSFKSDSIPQFLGVQHTILSEIWFSNAAYM